MTSQPEPTSVRGRGRGSRGISSTRQPPPAKSQPLKPRHITEKRTATQPPAAKSAQQDMVIHPGLQQASKNLHPGLVHTAYDPVCWTSTQKYDKDRQAKLQAAASERLVREVEADCVAKVAATEDQLRREDKDYGRHAAHPDLHPQDPIEDDGKS